MQLQELMKNALIDSGLVDYAIGTVEAEMLMQVETLARQSVGALNNDPALSFGLDVVRLDNVGEWDIDFPLPEKYLTAENGGAMLLEKGEADL